MAFFSKDSIQEKVWVQEKRFHGKNGFHLDKLEAAHFDSYINRHFDGYIDVNIDR